MNEVKLHLNAHQKVQRLALAAADLGLQHRLSQAHPSSAQAVTKQRSLCYSYQAAPRLAQMVTNLNILNKLMGRI